MHKMEELKRMLEKELDKFADKGELSAGSLDVVDKLTHALKSISTIIAMKEYSEDDYSTRGGRSYASPSRGRGSNARRDSMGRYSSRYDYDSDRMYSRNDAKHELLEHLYDLESMAKDSETKHMIKKFIKQAEED